MPELGPDVSELNVLVENITPDILHAKIGAKGRWEVPKSIFNAPPVQGAAPCYCIYLQCCNDLTNTPLMFELLRIRHTVPEAQISSVRSLKWAGKLSVQLQRLAVHIRCGASQQQQRSAV